MNILIFTHNYPVSKTERRNAGIFVHDMACELVKTNRVSIVCPASFDKKVRFGRVTVYFFSWGRNKHLGKLKFLNPLDLFYGLNLIFRGIKTLSTAVSETKPDFTLAMWVVPGGFFAYITKIKFGIPYAVWVLGSDFYVYAKLPIIGLLIRYVLKKADYTYADGIGLSEQVSKVIGKKCYFLPSSTNLNLRLRKKVEKKNAGKIVLTFIGRMEFIKGPDVFMDSILKLGDQAKNFKVNLLGDGSLLEALKQKVAKSGVTDHVKFYGNVDDKRIITKVLADSCWIVIPSRSDSIPLVFSEAMKAGVPVIASELEDLVYFIRNYQVGLIFKPADSDQLFSIIKTLPSLESQRRKYAKNTTRVARFFSLQTSAQTFMKMIQNG